jgi:hypothetical protein
LNKVEATETFPDYSFKLLYNKPDHILLNGKRKLLFVNYKSSKHEIKTSWCIPILSKVKLPLSAPFACPEIQHLTVKETSHFILSTIDILKQYQVESVEIVLPPEGYSTYHTSLIAEILMSEGFGIKKVINHFLLDVNKEVLFEQFVEKIQVRKLKKAREKYFTFDLVGKKNVKEIYQFIFEQRQNKKYQLSLSFDKIKKILTEFPQSVKLFCVKDETKIIAACIAILPDDSTCYTLYYDQDLTYKSTSPNVFLLEGIYNWCKTNHIKRIDLGSAHIDNKPNIGLQDFKLNAGAYPSAKLTLYKEL